MSEDVQGKVAQWWHPAESGDRLVCELCPRGCALGPGARGFCFVRQNVGGQMLSTTYGRSTGFCIDPIEKKPLNQFYPGSAVLSFGTAGCNLGCKFCQNWTSTKSREVDRYAEEAEAEAIAEAAAELGCRSVAFTYNDPIVWAEYAIDTARACHERGVKTVAVTSGYIQPAARTSFFEVMDAANVDLKGFTEDFYRKLTGGHLEPVLDTLKWLARKTNVWLEITNLIIPRENDSPQEIQWMCQWIARELGPDVPLHFSAFHPDFEMLDRKPTPPATLAIAYDVAREAGLHYVYTGNIHDPQRQSTYCPACGGQVIERDGYRLGKVALEDGQCGHCGAVIAGRYDPTVGNWGSRRQPVQIAAFAGRKGREESRVEGRESREEDSKEQRDNGAGKEGDSPVVEAEIGTVPSETKVATVPQSPARPELDAAQEQAIFRAAGRRVIATACKRQLEGQEELLGQAGQWPLFGVFVTLKRAGRLRSCCGFLGQPARLGEALEQAAVRTAKEDPRFPPISPVELAHLDMDVWLLWGLEEVTARGRDRVGAITLGKHGLQIARGAARGLLLPGVATEHGLDALAFLEQVCLKAGLPRDAWHDDQTTLMTFEGHAISGRLDPAEMLGVDPSPAPGGPTREELASLAEFCHRNLIAMAQGATPSYYLPGGFDQGVSGVSLELRLEHDSGSVECSKLAIRAEMPLQATLFSLAQMVAQAIASRRIDAAAVAGAKVGLSVLWDPAMHGGASDAALEGFDPRGRALVVAARAGWVWIYDPQAAAETILQQGMEQLSLQPGASADVLSMAIASTEPQKTVRHLAESPAVRGPAVAGQFYPSHPKALERMLDQMIPPDRRPESWAAALVPHAGWVYSGALAAKVLSRVAIPTRVIVLCPHHRAEGAAWAAAPHETWSLPARSMASDPELAKQLAEAISGLELDADAHRAEHAIEVQLPILARLAPESRVVGVAMAGGEWPDVERFGKELAELIRTLPERPLLVISSDMNHFADEQETRRLDRLVLDALESLDPKRVFDTVREHRVSMCGMIPAVCVMETLRNLGLLRRSELVGYTTSAEASGDASRVVGYAGMLFGD